MAMKAGRSGANKKFVDRYGNVIGGGGGDVTIESLSVTENGTYTAPSGKAYTPVSVNVPTLTKESLSVTENGTYNAPSGKAYDPVSVNVPTLTKESLSVTENGTYNAPSGKAYDPVVVNVSSSAQPIASWDFTRSTDPLIDTVNGLTATLNGSSATQSDSGITIADAASYISFPETLKGCARVYEIEMGNMTLLGTGGARLLSFANSGTFIFKDNQEWLLYSGSWSSSSGITQYDFFANSTVKFEISPTGYWKIYKDNVLVYEPNRQTIPANTNAYCSIGSSSYSMNSAVIKKFRVY